MSATATPGELRTRRHEANGCPSSRPAAEARDRFRKTAGSPLFVANWSDAVFFHFRIPAAVLQPHVGYPLDLLDGHAVVTLVAFRMENFHCPALSFLGKWPWRPFADQRFLNVRTYVRHRGESGILFLAEFLSNRLCVALGPGTYGLPYRRAAVEVLRNGRRFRGRVARGPAEFRYSAQARSDFGPCQAGSDAEWLLERHTAFTVRRNRRCCFRIWHEPWPMADADPADVDTHLLAESMPWWTETQSLCAHCTPGATDVWMSQPRSCEEG